MFGAHLLEHFQQPVVGNIPHRHQFIVDKDSPRFEIFLFGDAAMGFRVFGQFL